MWPLSRTQVVIVSKRFFLIALACLGLAYPAGAADWKPITPAELAQNTAVVQPGADAEALFWEVRVSDEYDSNAVIGIRTIFDHYMRVKIFTERGRDILSTVDINFEAGTDVGNVAARTIRPDGSIVELKSSDVYERTVVKTGDVRQKVMSFAVPAIAPGMIVEYQWREVHHDSVANYMALPFSRDIPVREARYFVRPLDTGGDFRMEAMTFNGSFAPTTRERDGFTRLSLSNVPADRTEPYATPSYERRPWVLIYYRDAISASTPEGMFREFSKSLYDDYAKRAKPTDEIRKLATAAVEAAKTRDERIAALMQVVRRTVRRTDVDTASAELRAAKENNDVDDVVKRGVGDATDARVLFIALANSSGFEARIAATTDRAQFLQTPGHQHPFFMSGRLVALRDNDAWMFVDPANEYSLTGAVRWNYSGHEAIVSDPKQMVSQAVPLAVPATSVKRRIGKLRLSEDGTLEGEWRLEYGGYWSAVYREQDDDTLPAEREKKFVEDLTRRLPGAVISNVALGQIDPSQPYVNTYQIRVPGYAQRTGTRLLFQPLAFQKGLEALFPSTSRTADVYFQFPWSENDEVTIALPAGYELEQPELPTPADVGVANYRVTMGVAADGSRLVTRRALVFGLQNSILFGQPSYASVKGFFDAVHTGDGHTLVLRRKATAQ
jgi:transglutaminase-like putative cysteine protease